MKNLSDNIDENKDLEFIPFETKDNIFNSDANWFPVIRLNTATIDTITNQFITGFSNPITKSTLDREKFNNIIEDEEYTYNEVEDAYKEEETYKIEEPKINKVMKFEGPSEKRIMENTIENKKINKSNKHSKKGKGKTIEKNRKEEKDKEKIFSEPPHMKVLRDYNLLYLEEESRLETLSLSENIYKDMMEEIQEIFDVLKTYEIPQPIIDIIIKKIIRITLDNCSNE